MTEETGILLLNQLIEKSKGNFKIELESPYLKITCNGTVYFSSYHFNINDLLMANAWVIAKDLKVE